MSQFNLYAAPPFFFSLGKVNVTLQEDEDYSSLGVGPTTAYTISSADLGAVGADRKIVVTAGGTRSAAAQNNITGITVGGYAMTHVVSVNNGDARSDTAIFIIDAGTGSDLEASTSADVVITFDSSSYLYGAGVYRMTGAGSTTASDTATDTSGSPYSVSIDCPANGVIIGHLNVNGGTAAGWTNLTEDFDYSGNGSAAHDEFSTAQTSLSVSVTASSGTGGLCVASWGP